MSLAESKKKIYDQDLLSLLPHSRRDAAAAAAASSSTARMIS